MKMYKETFKRLSPIGIALAVATLIYTIITGGQDCFGEYTRGYSTTAIGMTPVLVYYVFTAIVFGMYGFSFLFQRSASDLFHSLPVKRTDIYLSTTLATATWMGGTILLNVLVMLGMQLVGGIPFVPAYVPLTILFYFVAAMLVYAATAIGCALSGTFLTALASTGVVLFLPRFVQFIIARGVVAKTSIIGWLDLGTFLNPMSNVATSLVVAQSRGVYIPFMVNLSYTLYSLIPLALELCLAAWLFLRRPSETAEHGTGRNIWAAITACLLAFAAMLMITVDNKPLISMYGGALVAIAFLVFVVYQVIASRSVKQILFSLPLFLVSGALAFGISLSIGGISNSMLNTTPKPDEISSVTFRGHDYRYGKTEYTTLLVSKIAYTSESMKKYVSDTLSDAVDRVNNPNRSSYDEYSQYQVIESITLKLTNGLSIDRTIIFKNIDTLNELRSESDDYQTAIHAFPQNSEIQSLSVDSTFTKAESQAIWDSLVSESQSLGLISNDYYRKQTTIQNLNNDQYNYMRYSIGNEQTLSGISTDGFVSQQRFADYHNLRFETPKTVKLMMETFNKHMKADTTARLKEAVKHIASPLALENDSMNLSLTFYNVPWTDGEHVEIPVNLYISGYSKQSDTYADQYISFMQRFADILSRAKPTSDPSKLFVWLNWTEYDSTNGDSSNDPQCFLSIDPTDEQALSDLINEYTSLY